MQKIAPYLWFDHQAVEAVNFYCSIFKDSRVGRVARYGEAGPGKAGTVLTIEFQIAGQDFVALNGGPHFKFTPAISLAVDCRDQAEVDEMWEKLSAGGEKSQCGWVTDKYGLSWQVVPCDVRDMLHGSDKKKADRMMKALLGMTKLDIAALRKAYEG